MKQLEQFLKERIEFYREQKADAQKEIDEGGEHSIESPYDLYVGILEGLHIALLECQAHIIEKGIIK